MEKVNSITHQTVRDMIDTHKKKIELFQWASISGLSSLIYSEYIRHMQQKTIPVRAVLVPNINEVRELLSGNSKFMDKLFSEYISRISTHPLIIKYSNSPELVMFKDHNIEILKIIFDLYIANNIMKQIPDTIVMKFQLNRPDQQLFRQDNHIPFINPNQITDNQFQFIIDETVLHLLMLMPTMKKETTTPSDNMSIQLNANEILTIGHENAICPIHIDASIIENNHVMGLLSFVTSTNILDQIDNTYFITTSPFNQIMITNLHEIEYEGV